jgi:RNA polymerase sigma-70 factor (ECF subfamily)
LPFISHLLFESLLWARLAPKLVYSVSSLGKSAWNKLRPAAVTYPSGTPGAPLANAGKMDRFEQAVLCHLDSAYNLARWLTRDGAGAEDAVQEACLKAFRFFESQHGANPRAWFMTVVRNACLDWLKEHQRRAAEEEYDDDEHGAAPGGHEQPEVAAERAADARWLHECLAALPREYREVLVLRELEELSYKEISAVVDVPIGTVMSRIARGRDLLQRRLVEARRRKRL